MIPTWGELKFQEDPLWEWECLNSRAIATCSDGVLVATDTDITAIDLEQGTELWRKSLSAPPVPWGMAVDRNGRVIVVLKNGHIVCFGSATGLAAVR